MANLTKYEQETIINYNSAESMVSVYSADPVVIKKLDKLVDKYPDHYKCTEVDQVSKTQVAKSYEIVSKRLIQFRQPRQMTEEQRQAAITRLENYKKNVEANNE